MSLTLKVVSLTIRTLAKPIANTIKRNAREHERFKKACIGLAQGLHRADMHMRLGLLQDPAVIERQIQKEVAEAEARKKKAAIPTVKTEAQTKAEQAEAKAQKGKIEEHVKSSHKPRIRPLSEAKAIETGANFISEAFLYAVAIGLILFETKRRERKETNRQEGVADKIEMLEVRNLDQDERFKRIEEHLATVLEQLEGHTTSQESEAKIGLATTSTGSSPPPKADTKLPFASPAESGDGNGSRKLQPRVVMLIEEEKARASLFNRPNQINPTNAVAEPPKASYASWITGLFSSNGADK